MSARRSIKTREEWLGRAAELLRRRVFAPVGRSTFPSIRYSCGWPGGGSARKRIGEAWNTDASADGKTWNVFVSPNLADPVRVLDVLAHEIVHTLTPGAKHGAPFRRLATAIGLRGKMTATVAGPELEATLREVAEALGPYPHAKLSLSGRPKQSTRMLKVECDDCGCIVRMTQKWLDEVGPPTCGCGGTMN